MQEIKEELGIKTRRIKRKRKTRSLWVQCYKFPPKYRPEFCIILFAEVVEVNKETGKVELLDDMVEKYFITKSSLRRCIAYLKKEILATPIFVFPDPTVDAYTIHHKENKGE